MSESLKCVMHGTMKTGELLKKGGPLVFVTRNLPPLVGGMENLGANICRILEQEFELSIIGPNGCRRHFNKSTVKECGFSSIYKFLFCSMAKVVFTAVRKQPAIVFGGSGLMAPSVAFASRISSAASICYLHGLDIIVPNPIYQSLFVPRFRQLDLLLVNSQNTARLAQEKGVVEDKIRVLHPCVEKEVQIPSTDVYTLREKYDLNDRTILLSVGRLAARKGLCEFVRDGLPLVKNSIDNVLLAVVGGEASQAVEPSTGQVEMLREAANELGLSDAIRIFNSVDDDTLEDLYQIADLFVFPGISRGGDVEGFGIVAVEAAAHGLPTVAFSVGGIPDAVQDSVSGYLIPPGDYERFANTIVQHILEQRNRSMESDCRNFARKFSPARFATQLIDYCREATEIRDHNVKTGR